MSYREDLLDILSKIESELQDIYSDLEDIKGIAEVDYIKESLDSLLKQLY